MLLILMEAAARSMALAIAVWIALRLVRVRSPRDQCLAWAAVLLASASMPLLMKAVESLMAPPALAWIPATSPSLFLRPLTAVVSNTTTSSVDFFGMITIVYGAIVMFFLIRLASGLRRSRRLVKRATLLREAWTQDHDVRVSKELTIPATIGSTILLPYDYFQWDTFTREAVLAHESAHVRRRDFYTHMLSGFHQAVFWFSPLAWWLRSQLLELAETASDDEAIGKVKDRTVYAGLLVDFASRGAKIGFVAVGMARGGTVTGRVERILADHPLPRRSSLMRSLVFTSVFVVILGLSVVAWTVRAEPRALAAPLATLVSPPQAALSVQPVGVQARIVPLPQLQLPARQANESALAGWIDKEVPDIATREEREAFLRLAIDEERERFIEMFWLRRDPTPPTVGNEFRDEYYRRIVVANRRYGTNGTPGWLTDRGRILVMHGDPDEIETHAGFTDRNPGRPPLEQWLYRYIEGVGANVILTFVDGLATPAYRLEPLRELVPPATPVSPAGAK